MQLRAGAFAKQSTVISAQVIQSIRLLQYSGEELRDFLANQAERNPFVEVVSGAEPAAAHGEKPGSDTERTALPSQPPSDVTGTSYRSRVGTRLSSSAGTSGEAPNLEEFCASAVSLKDHLREQAAFTFRDQVDNLIAAELIDSIEPDGYLRTDITRLADRLGAEQERVEQVLSRIQGFEPAGVGARDLAECLAIQLRERNRLDPAMETMLRNLPLLASYELTRLAGLCGVSIEDIADMVKEIRSLDPRPGNRFDASPVQPAMPDVLVRTGPDGTCTVELNTALLPRVLVNRQYCAEITTTRLGEEDRRFVMDCMKNATWLAKNLDQRARTILKVATEIVTRQAEFFRHGVEHLVPLCLKDVAEVVGIHESTVCRAISNKYMMTNRGMFEMRYFFSNSIAAVDGAKEHSPEMVRHRISTLISAETADNVMSDDAIVIELRKSGIDIARRTIAKYRDMMNIPSSTQRRRRKQIEHLKIA